MANERVGSEPSDTGLRVKIDQSRPRQTANTSFGHVMGEGLSRSADAVLQAGQLAAPFIPGGAVLSAAISGVGTLKSSAGGQSMSVSGAETAVAPNSMGLSGGSLTSGSSTSGTIGSSTAVGTGGAPTDNMARMEKMQEMNMSFNMQYLMLQQKMQDESRRFSLLSNIMKTKHDTAKNSINNVR